MAEKRVQAAARVTLTIEIMVDDSWGGDCPLSQIHKQAAEAAVGSTRRLSELLATGRARLIGEPAVVAILTEYERG